MHIELLHPSDPLWLQTLAQLRHDMFHLPQYVALEAHRMAASPEAFLAIEQDKQLFVPYLIRSCRELLFEAEPGADIYDAVSPYAYSGILVSSAAEKDLDFLRQALDQLAATLRAKQVCSAFLRLHPALSPDLTQLYPPHICQVMGEIIQIDLTQPKEALWRDTRTDHRKDINRHKRLGITAKMVDLEAYLPEFMTIYEETMDRVNAAQGYYFGENYFRKLIALTAYLHLCVVEIEAEVASACLITESCGIVSSFLGGSKNKFRQLTPEKLLFDYVRSWAKDRGNQIFNMGGGVGCAKDGVYYFKAGFSKQRGSFITLRLVTDEGLYGRLVASRAKSFNVSPAAVFDADYFPAYRCAIADLKTPQPVTQDLTQTLGESS